MTALWDFLILVAMSMFGTYAIFVKSNPSITPITFLFWFQIVGAVVFVVFYGFNGFPVPGRRERRMLMWLALATVLNDLLLFTGFRFATAGKVVIAHQCDSLFAPWIALMFLRERTTRNEWIAWVFSGVTAVLLYLGVEPTPEVNSTIGVTLGLLSTIPMLAFTVLYRKLREDDVDIVTVNAWRFGISFLMLLPFAYFTPLVPTGGFFVPSNISVLVTFGVLFAVVASGMHNIAISHARLVHTTIINNTEIIFAALWAFFLLGEKLGANTIAGGIIIIATSIWLGLQKGDMS